MYDLDITTSDYDDEDIEKNILHNHVANGIPVSPHIRRKSFEYIPSIVFQIIGNLCTTMIRMSKYLPQLPF